MVKSRKPLNQVWEKTLGGSAIESTDSTEKTVVDCGYNALYASIINSHNYHVPLTLYPDAIWIQIVQQLAIHIRENAEALRDTFVDFAGKKVLTVRRDSFTKGAFNNPWDNVFPEFAEQIKEFIGEGNYNAIVSEFTTTTSTTKAAQEIALMDCVQTYFKFLFMTLCGIPLITLEGERKDWQAIVDKAKTLEKYGLEWWLKELVPVLQEFVNVYDGDINYEFWESFVNVNESSGGPYFTGHMTKFSAYTPVYPEYSQRSGAGLRQTAFRKIDHWMAQSGPFEGMTTKDFMTGQSSVPFLWAYICTVYPMTFSSGFVGFEVVDGAFRPNISWAVSERQVPNSELQKEVDQFAKELVRDLKDTQE